MSGDLIHMVSWTFPRMTKLGIRGLIALLMPGGCICRPGELRLRGATALLHNPA